MRDENLPEVVKLIIDQAGITPESLELEITEGVLMDSYTHVVGALSALDEMGVKIAMDDFGTGYSSLSYLRNYPFDTVKIDRSFVNDIIVDESDQKLVSAAIAMAHSLGLKVVAEGVETSEQLAMITSQGCDFAQGYLFSKPLRCEAITEMLESQS